MWVDDIREERERREHKKTTESACTPAGRLGGERQETTKKSNVDQKKKKRSDLRTNYNTQKYKTISIPLIHKCPLSSFLAYGRFSFTSTLILIREHFCICRPEHEPGAAPAFLLPSSSVLVNGLLQDSIENRDASLRKKSIHNTRLAAKT